MARSTVGFSDIHYPSVSGTIASGTVYYQEGTGSIRACRRPDIYGQLISGYLFEASDDEYCLYSTDANSWTKSNVTTPSTITSPLHGIPAYAVVESSDGGATIHYIASTINALNDTSGQTIFTYAVIAAGDRDTFRYYVLLAASAALSVNVNLSTETFDVVTGSLLDSGIETIGTFGGKEFKFVWMKFQSSSGAGNSRIILYTGDYSYQGDGSTCFYLAYAGLRIGASSITSPIVSTTATTTRAADAAISYDYSNDNNNGSFVLDFLNSGYNSEDLTLFDISDGGSSSDRITGYIASGGYPSLEVVSGGVTQSDISIEEDVCTDEKKRIGFTWSPRGSIVFLYDYHTQTTSSGTDMGEKTIPTGLDTIELFGGINSVVGNIKLLDKSIIDGTGLINY